MAVKNKDKRMSLWLKYTLIALPIIIIVFLIIYYILNMTVVNYKIAVSENNYFAHALGGIDKNRFTNSKEALESSYKAGFKFFEADIRLTSDNKLVLISGWGKTDYEEFLGWEYNATKNILNYETFMSSKIKNKYTTMSFLDLLDFMKKHKDIYVMIDIGTKSAKETTTIYKELVKEANNDDKILQRLIVTGYTTKMINAIKKEYDFKLINMVWQEDAKREKSIKGKKKFAKFCKDNKITSITVASGNYDKDLAYYMKKKGLMIYVYTINNEKKANSNSNIVDLIGTDFLKPIN